MCIFCDIIKSESKKLYEDNDFVIINDISHKANVHYLVIPKVHYANLSEQTEEQGLKLGIMLNKLPKILEELGVSGGYRLIINQGENAGQTFHHLHVHVLGGEKLPEMP